VSLAALARPPFGAPRRLRATAAEFFCHVFNYTCSGTLCELFWSKRQCMSEASAVRRHECRRSLRELSGVRKRVRGRLPIGRRIPSCPTLRGGLGCLDGA
jgi:hypothetical protein